MSTKLNKATKKEIANGIQELYINTFEFNSIANNPLHTDSLPRQLNVTTEEAGELVTALAKQDLKEVGDAIVDCLVTGCFLVGIQDGNDDITKNPPLYLNESDSTLEVLVPEAIHHLEEVYRTNTLGILSLVKHKDYIEFLSTVEDMCAVVNLNIVDTMKSVGESNLSKFPLVTAVSDPESVCEAIEDQGRYDNVSYEESVKFGEPCYVFKATYDKENDKRYTKGKIVKPPAEFGYTEPTIYLN
jgi:hypothetical protein